MINKMKKVYVSLIGDFQEYLCEEMPKKPE